LIEKEEHSLPTKKGRKDNPLVELLAELEEH